MGVSQVPPDVAVGGGVEPAPFRNCGFWCLNAKRCCSKIPTIVLRLSVAALFIVGLVGCDADRLADVVCGPRATVLATVLRPTDLSSA